MVYVWYIYIDVSIYISYITYNRILVSHEKEWHADTRYNITEPWKHYAKQNKQDIEGHILYESTYMKCPEKVNPINTKVD